MGQFARREGLMKVGASGLAVAEEQAQGFNVTTNRADDALEVRAEKDRTVFVADWDFGRRATVSKFTVQAKTCIKGEAFFESLIAEYAIPHHIEGAKDLGADYLCEWSYDDKPSGILFAAQVKTFKVKGRNKPKSLGQITPTLNALEAFSIDNPNLTIKQPTLDYWRGLGLPTYLFVVAHTRGGRAKPDEMALYYKRFTTVLTSTTKQEDEDYYQVDNGAKFLAFADQDKRTQGFARDLFIDFMRWCYFKGSIAWMNPRKLGLQQFPEEDDVFEEFIEKYKKQICETYAKAKPFLDRYCG